MNFVQPIRDREKLEEMKMELKKKGTRNYMLFLTGINTGLRVSDIVTLNVDDVRHKNGQMKSHIVLTEQKTKKTKRFPLCNTLFEELELWIGYNKLDKKDKDMLK